MEYDGTKKTWEAMIEASDNGHAERLRKIEAEKRTVQITIELWGLKVTIVVPITVK